MNARTLPGVVALFFVCFGASAQSNGAGKAVFDRHCVHRHGASNEAPGTVQLERTRGEPFALLEERSDLVGPHIDFIVRNGLRAMPAFVPSELTQEQLAVLVAYLTGDGGD